MALNKFQEYSVPSRGLLEFSFGSWIGGNSMIFLLSLNPTMKHIPCRRRAHGRCHWCHSSLLGLVHHPQLLWVLRLRAYTYDFLLIHVRDSALPSPAWSPLRDGGEGEGERNRGVPTTNCYGGEAEILVFLFKAEQLGRSLYSTLSSLGFNLSENRFLLSILLPLPLSSFIYRFLPRALP